MGFRLVSPLNPKPEPLPCLRGAKYWEQLPTGRHSTLAASCSGDPALPLQPPSKPPSLSALLFALLPLQVRTRRAPASFQDFHLEGRASGSPDRAGVHLSGAAAADMQRRMLAVQQQLHHGWHGPARAAGPGSNPQQAQAALPARQSNLGRQQLLPPRGMQGPQGRHQQQQQPGAGILSEEFMQKFRATIDMVRSSGSAGGMEGAAALLADPAALHAFVSALSRHTDDPAAAMHRVAATLAAYATQQQPQQ